jgi:cell division septation protein DedD
VEPRTHYQISLTARQAIGAFVALLLALGLAFFFGLMTGLSGRGRREPEPRDAESVAAARLEPEALRVPVAETAVPALPGRREPARPAASGDAAPAAANEPTPPQTLQTFEDGGAEETPAAAPPTPAPAPPAHGAAAAAPKAAPTATPGRVWVQVASVSTRSEADGLSSRLAKHGYRPVVAPDKGRLRVRVGPYRTTEDARRAAEKLRQQEKIKSPWVVFEGK